METEEKPDHETAKMTPNSQRGWSRMLKPVLGREEQELQLLMEGDTVKPRHSTPDLIPPTTCTRMLVFNLPEARKRQVHEYLEECALRAKVKLMVAHMKEMALAVELEEEEEEREPTPAPEYEVILQRFADINPPPIAQSWLDNIYKILTPKMVHKHSNLVRQIIEEVKQEYQKTLHKLSVFMKFGTVLGEPNVKFLLPLKSDVGGKTPNYDRFIAFRRVIENELFLTHPLIRKILSSSKLAIPEVLVNFKNYRKRGWLHLDKLLSLITSDMKKAEHQICKNWYPKLINMISVKNSLETVPMVLWPRFVRCASTVVSVQITQLMQRTISHIIETLSDINTFPQLNLDAYFQGSNVAMIPSEDEIFISFHRIIDTISYMAQDMPAMEAWFAVACPNKFIAVKRSESFLRASHQALEDNLYDLFTPVRDYLRDLGEEFSGLCSERQQQEIKTFIKEQHTYEEMFEKVSYIKMYSRKVKKMVYKEYFSVVRVSQSDVITHLNKLANGFMTQILQEITAQQINENKKICSEFEKVAERTLHMPVKTRELVAMGSYIKYCRTTFMDHVKGRILGSVQLAIRLMDFTGLTDEQLRLNARIVNWLNKIKPIFQEYNDLFENTKYELEERLQRSTEKLNKELEDVGPSLTSLSNMDDVNKIAEYVQFIQKFLRRLEQFDGIVTWINNEEVLFKFPISTYPELDELKSIVHPFAKLIFTCSKWLRTYKIWMDGAFDELILESVEEQVSFFFQDLTSTQKTYKTKCKQQATDNYPRRFKGTVDDPDVNNWPAPLKLCSQTLNHINEFKQNLRLIGIVCNSALRKRHWDDLSEIAGFAVTPDAGTTLRKFICYHLEHLLDPFEVVSVSACKELQLYQTLCAMKAEWTDVYFTSTPYLDTKTEIFCDVEDILTLVDNHLIKCVSIRGSAFVKPLIAEVKEWCERLERVNLTIETWLRVEKQWMDFHPIFTCETVRDCMDKEVLLFQEVDKMYRELMKDISQGLQVIKTAGDALLLRSVQRMSTILENINAGVKVYLNQLQMYFPRLFFLSDFEILQILAETKSTDVIHTHLAKLFIGIQDLCYENNKVIAMQSSDGEQITFDQPLQVKDYSGCVEKLLFDVEKQMQSSMKLQCKKCLTMYKKEGFSEWVVGWPGQAVQCALVTIRTGQIHNCLAQQNLEQLNFVYNNVQNQKEVMFSLIQGPLGARVRTALEALVILTVHVLELFQLMFAEKTISDTDFNWLVQLRYYQEEIVKIRLLNSVLPYGYEYLGNTSRLVITPLTERCFRTLITAYHMNLHGAPEGPPGTGKSETVGDLAKAVGVYCFSFCCTPGLSHVAIGKFLRGVAGCGAWGCLNDFHQMRLEVLSVVAQQLASIASVIRSAPPSNSPHCYVCVTLYPGISVHSPIPANLKMLFRPVAMMLPDTLTIAEVFLYSFGFTKSHDLALKLVTLQKLCTKQSSQHALFCYDFGSLKSVLKEAKRLKQKQKGWAESDIVLKAITDTLGPRLSDDDTQVLHSVLDDLFPGHPLSSHGAHHQLKSSAVQDPLMDNGIYLEVGGAQEKICEDLKLKCGDVFISKIIQIHEALKIYTGIILLGDPFTGKSSALKVVRHILGTLKEEHISPINPKTLTLSQMYGYIHPESSEWIDGIIPKFFRESKSRQWLVVDGPMESCWLDTLNTAFDLSHRLCLSSGEIIPVSSDISVVFETMDLDQVSPATVSRCGVVFSPPDAIGWRGLVHSWLSSSLDFHSNYATNYHTLFDWIVPPTLAFVENNCCFVMKAGRCNMVRTMLLLIEMMLKDACADNEDFSKHLPVWIQSSTLLAGVWAFGGSLTPDSREQFDIFFRDIWKGNIENHPMPETIEKLEINIPSEGQLNDYWYHFKGKGAWRFWPEVVRSLKIEEDTPNLQFTLVSTIESAKYLNILEMHVKHLSPLLLVGPTASGKTLYFNKTINKLSLEKYLPISISFSPFSSAHFFQDYVISKLQRRSQARYAAPGGRTAVLMVDDVNMGPQAPMEVIHHYLDHHQWFRTKDNSKVAIEDLLLFSACGMPGGHKQHISPRILRHFSFFALSPLSDETVTKIFSTLLFTGFKRNGFATDVMPTVLCIVAATADVLQWITQTLRPTPSKPHYAFTLRDYAKLIHSHLLVKRENIDSKKVFIRLWVHEALRVFSDRLIEPHDRAQLILRLRFAVKECFKESFDVSLDNLMPKGQEEIQEENIRNLIFTTALTCENEDKKYEEVGSLDQFMKALAPIIENHNSTQETKLNIVLFRFALEHLSRLCRVLSTSGGSCLMLGLRGSGRQTITQLAALLCKAHFHQPSVVHNYGFSEWREDLKQVLVSAGGHNAKTVFFVSENELSNDSFLQDIDMVLSTGQVPDMFSSSELEQIFDMVRLSAQGGNRNLDINPLTVFAFFVSRCRQNLHVILSLSSISYSFRRWLSLYPSLLNYCTVDWVEPYKTMTFNGKEYKLKDWPEEALEKIAFHYWEGLEIEEAVLDSAVKLCKYIHVTARETTEKFYAVTGRKCYVTSASYLMMVKKYRYLIAQKQQEIIYAKAQFITGLEKLEFAAKQVSVMQKELEALQPQLQVAAAETERMMEVIERETVVIEQASGLVREDEKVAKVQAAAANNLKIECEADLALAIPILEEAVAALNTLKPTDITLVKSMKNPPDTVKLVMAAVCVMKDIKPEKIPDPNTPGRKIQDYWGPSKRLLGDMAFLQQLKDYDKDNIPPPIMAMIRKQYLPNKDFKPHIVAKASSAAEGLCKWVIAMDMYDAVAKEVAPKKAKLEIAEREFAATMAILEEKRAQVRMLEEKLMDLNAKLDAAQQRKKVLEDEVGVCENKLWKAERLIGGLGGEKGRWTETADALQTCYDSLAGDILLSCGVIAYLAPLTFQFRQSLLCEWCRICHDLKIPMSEIFSFVKVLGFDINIQNWNIFGLPRDEFSIENAVILENTVRCPLLIDPQGHANRWIKSKEKSNNLQVIRLSDEDYMKTVETSMTAGIPVLLENVEEDLNVILLSPLFVRRTVDPDGKKIPCIYITTRLQNPTFSPTVFNNFSVINFTLTLNGLEDKLLDIVIAKERPDLQEKKLATIISSSDNKAKLQQVESQILDTLSYTKGNILENEAAIEILDTAKTLSVEIKEKQKLARIIEEEIHSYCQLYFAVVEHSARLYFCLTNLVSINYMYQFSLDWFLKTYVTSIDTANKSQVMEVRLQYLENRITYNLYQNVCCSLFEKHRVLFCLLLCTTIELAKKTILEEDLNFLFGVKEQHEEVSEVSYPFDWISKSAWRQIYRLDQLSSYSGFAQSLSSDQSKWKALQNSDKMEFPDPWNSQLSSFQKLNIIKIIYPDKMRDGIVGYVGGCMGPHYATPPSLDLSCSFEDSNCLTPLLFLMCPGSDPAAALQQFAKKKNFQNRLYTISLGVNQGEAASRLIAQCREEGSWVLLQNCHLAPDYMPGLDRLCDHLTLHNTSMEFRLWLTSAPSTQFPVSILQSSVKITTDLPPGLKRRLLHSFQSEPIIVEDFFYGCPGKDRAFAKLLYSLCFLHTLVQERKKYGHSGWNILYEFYDIDFNMSLQQLQMYINEYQDIPYAMIQYVVGECNYGGRVQDRADLRLLRTIMGDIVNPRVAESPNYRLSTVTVPLRFEYHDFLLAIQELPDDATAEVFGLNLNAEIKHNLEITKELFENLELLQPTSARRKLTHKPSTLSYVESVITKFPEELSLDAEHDFPASGLGFVLRQECALYSTLLATVRTSLYTFRNAFLGLAEMSEDIELFGFQVEKGLIPTVWLKVSYATCKPLASYLDDLVDRLKYIKECCRDGVGRGVWLGGMFQPQALLVSALHEHSRATNTPLHLLCWDHHVKPTLSGPGDNSLLVSGLYLHGANWNPTLSMLEEQPLRIFTSEMPEVWFNPVLRSERGGGSRYKCPLYETAARGNFVAEVWLPSDRPPSHWIYRGVVLLCQSDS